MYNDKYIENEAIQFELIEKMKELPTETLFNYLKSEDINERYAAKCIISIRGEKFISDKLVTLCYESDKRMREIGASVLGQYRISDTSFILKSLSVLINLLQNDPDGSVRAGAASALGHICSSAEEEDIVYSLNTDALPALISAVSDPEAEVRENVAFALGCFRKAEITDPLLLLTADTDEEVRNWAAFGLRQLNSENICSDTPRLKEGLAKMLKDTHGEAMREALCALARLKDERAFEAVRKELDNDPVFYEIIEAAGNLGDIRLLGRLKELREEWKDDVPEELTDAISKIEKKQDNSHT